MHSAMVGAPKSAATVDSAIDDGEVPAAEGFLELDVLELRRRYERRCGADTSTRAGMCT